ncbi:DUF4261 domain-containing protein [Pseudovibrio brasiliensis]|uniref:DUF4261 domain-containing protein n=1 Tax=Pseudovibrio brasiliensis TaxID=1898042 RepID=A0ABX8ATF1_9HYPH|nr:DUF4261 domain-containing protein [Pseudovibrio brasiliensis]QUS56904.1 DUF4261 domain-containing protein [Pseudovibrio brasiliensis]
MSLFLTYLALAQPIELTAAEMCQSTASTYLGQPLHIECPVDDSDGKDANFVYVNGLPVAIMNIGFPLPADAYEEAVAIDKLWPEAGATLAESKSHIVLSALGSPKEHQEVLSAAKTMTLFAAYLSEKLPVTAQIGVEGKTVISPEKLKTYAQSLAQGEVPLFAWTSLMFFNGGMTSDGKQKAIMATNGFRPFIGREIETSASANLTPDKVDFVLNLGVYLIKNGPVINHGDTVGGTAEEKIKVVHKPQGYRPETPSLHVVLPDADVSELEGVGAEDRSAPPPPRKSLWPFGKRKG